ncbi:MAG TPA: potassium channel family protein [Wenzhouxiangella sp.]|nr:potassium channel family protein [Wenzhouxiangella sp.]
MAMTLQFLINLWTLLVHLLPLFLGLSIIIGALSVLIGRKENWSITDSLYFGFITALTVGYGDLRPTRGITKLLAIIIALFGLITSGILVAVAVEAVAISIGSRRAI